jgi:CRP-like cAMP-binding protein
VKWLRIEAGSIRGFAKESSTLYEVLLAHHYAFMSQVSQSVACNGLHSVIKRCCRWLLMTHDRVEGDEVALTHEFLSFMLGVRRPGVTEALSTLESQGLIKTARGTITITDRGGLERASCDCYRLVKEEYERMLGPTPS